MQNLGFAFALIPLIRQSGGGEGRASRMMTTHLQGFGTHPYLSASIIGSVVKLEEEGGDSPAGRKEIVETKNALMGPYAAIGDSFFWGAWRPFTLIAALIPAMAGFLFAPLLFLILYNPLHVWVRLKGFTEGYRRGREGTLFVQSMNLPEWSGRIRRLSPILLGILAALAAGSMGPGLSGVPGILTSALVLTTVLLCFWMRTRGIPLLGILYGTAALLTLFSL